MTNYYATKTNEEIISYLEIAAGRTLLTGELTDGSRACVKGALTELQGRVGEETSGRYIAATGIRYAKKILAL